MADQAENKYESYIELTETRKGLDSMGLPAPEPQPLPIVDSAIQSAAVASSTTQQPPLPADFDG